MVVLHVGDGKALAVVLVAYLVALAVIAGLMLYALYAVGRWLFKRDARDEHGRPKRDREPKDELPPS